MKNIKIYSKNFEHSRKIQEKLFEMGYSWTFDLGKEVSFEVRPFIYANGEGHITYGTDYKQFLSNTNFCEVELIETVSYEFKEIPKKEVVKIGENSYYVDELEVALKNIKPIQK